MAIDSAPTFLSYSRKDSDFALRLCRDLRQAGWNIWLDQTHIAAGQDWDLAIERALQDCARLMVVLSPDSASSGNVRDELLTAFASRKQVIPLLYKNCDIPLKLRRVQFIDCRGDYAASLADVLKALARSSPEGWKNGLPETKPVGNGLGEIYPVRDDSDSRKVGTTLPLTSVEPSGKENVPNFAWPVQEKPIPWRLYGTLIGVIVLGSVTWLTLSKSSQPYPATSVISSEQPAADAASNKETKAGQVGESHRTSSQSRPSAVVKHPVSRPSNVQSHPSPPDSDAGRAIDYKPPSSVPIAPPVSKPVDVQSPPAESIAPGSTFEGTHTLVVGLRRCTQQVGVIICELTVTRSGNFIGTLDMGLPDWRSVLIDELNQSHWQAGSDVLDRNGRRGRQLPLGPGETATVIQQFNGIVRTGARVRIRFTKFSRELRALVQ